MSAAAPPAAPVSAPPTVLRPANLAEAMVWHPLVWTWPLYGLGALYVVGPVLGWLIGGLAALVLYLGPAIRPDLRATGPVPGLVWLWAAGMLPLLLQGRAWQMLAGLAASMAVLGGALMQAVEGAVAGFRGARADSTRVRETLQRIAAERWETDAWWWGHGTVQPGPHLVEFMPIGSHHTWWGLLFVRGMVGFLAWLIPFAAHALRVTLDAACHRRGRRPLGILLTLLLLSFGENIEIQVYLLWPALVALGIHLREMATPPGGR